MKLIAVKFAVDVQSPFRMNPNDAGDPLTLSPAPATGQTFTY